MRRLMCLVLACLTMATISMTPRAQTPSGGTVAGVVLRADNGAPAAGIGVVLIDWLVPPSGGSGQVAEGVTDAEGRFRFTNVKEGKYKAIFAGTGYVTQVYGQRGGKGIWQAVEVRTDATADLSVALSALGAITGTVSNPAGEPLARVPVTLYTPSFDDLGRERLSLPKTAYTDDRGRYRFSAVEPGQYVVAMGGLVNNPGSDPGGIATGRNYALRFYPGTEDVRTAQRITVRSGETASQTDCVLSREKGAAVRGVTIDEQTGQPANYVFVYLAPVAPERGLQFNVPGRGDGRFEIRDIPRGEYLLIGVIQGDSPSPGAARGNPQIPQLPQFRRGRLVIKVESSDLDGIALVVPRFNPVMGRVNPEAGQNAPSRQVLRLISENRSSGELYDVQSQVSNERGEFLFESVPPGTYSLVSTPATRANSGYVKPIRFNGIPLKENRITVEAGREGNALEIIWPGDLAQLEGSVVTSRLSPAANATIVVVPDEPQRPELFRWARTDVNGHFVVWRLPPGNYSVRAFDIIDENAWFDSAVLQTSQGKVESIRVAPSSKNVINVNMEITRKELMQ
jgi:5-hydroxyisourate hydrolase-like protein (transthyretin family)